MNFPRPAPNPFLFLLLTDRPAKFSRASTFLWAHLETINEKQDV